MARTEKIKSQSRLRAFKVFIFAFGLLIGSRLFYIQVIQHDYYSARADTSHIKQYELDAKRGEIFALDGENKVPLAINQTQKKLIADPRFIGDAAETARQLAEVTGADQGVYQQQLERDTAYVVLEAAIPLDAADEIDNLSLKGIAMRDTALRVYPEGDLAAHVLGFVNAEGEGQYGLEQFFNEELSGRKGLLSGTFDVRGIPVAVADNIEIKPQDGLDLTLSIDRTIQRQVQELLKQGLERANSESGSVIVMDPNTGKVKALANYPTYSPANYSQVDDMGVYSNNAISSPYEPGSVIKAFTMSLGLESGAVTPSTTYYDPGYEVIDDFRIRNAGAIVAKTRDMTEVITRSVNTGVIHVLKHLSDGNESIDRSDKQSLYEFFTTKLGLGRVTNIELANESAGSVTKPEESSDVKYANMTFGQGLSMNLVHLAAGLSTLVNGGTYYQPSIIESYDYSDGTSVASNAIKVRENVISETTSQQIKHMLETVVEGGGGYAARRQGYKIGGKTGTAQLPNPQGGYFEDKDTGSFFGYGVSGEEKYVVVVRVDNPQIAGFAGSQGAAPIFADISNWLINYYGIKPQEGVN